MALSMMNAGTPEIRRALSEANSNFRLYRLKKRELQQICMFYGINTIGTKNILEQRIVDERDSIYHMSFHEPTLDTIKQTATRYRIRNVTRNVIDGNESTQNLYFSQQNKDYIMGMRLNREPKINVIIIYILLNKVKDSTFDKSYLEIFENKTRNELIDGIKTVCDQLIANSIPHPLQRTRKTLNIQNLSDQVVYIYYSRIRNDHPRFSQCNYIMNILPGNTNTMYYYDDSANIIFSKSNNGRAVYYMDLQDQSAIIQENIVNTLNGNIEFKGNKGELEKWKEAALKADFLIKQLKRLGIEKNENYSMIIDMHQDITIPEHTERDKEVAGVPSTLTNVT